MSKAKEDLRSKYKREDLGQGTRGKYLDEYRKGSNLVLLDPEVAKVFPNEEAVNEALKSLIRVARQSAGMPNVDDTENRR